MFRNLIHLGLIAIWREGQGLTAQGRSAAWGVREFEKNLNVCLTPCVFVSYHPDLRVWTDIYCSQHLLSPDRNILCGLERYTVVIVLDNS